jgi:O-antigen biosynthesis protein WbqP
MSRYMNSHTSLMIRAADIVISVGAGLVALPFVVLAGLLVRLESPGPALFRQPRVGLNERPFVCLKLRTMSVDTPSLGTHEVSAVAVTRIGRWLRRIKVDELPQLWNVLAGEMSLVGPRPCLPTQIELIEERRQRGVFRVRPGVTGSAQLKGIDMSTPAALAREDAVWAAAPNLVDYVRWLWLTGLGRGTGDRIRVG